MEIVKGKTNAPVRAVIYGPEGIGKTTLAAQWPKPVFIDVEAGTAEMDVERIDLSLNGNWQLVIEAVKKAGSLNYQTIVIDTADWAEKLLKKQVCDQAKVEAIGDVPYGQLYQQLATKWAQLLDLLRSTNKHIVLLAHSCLIHCDIPEENGSFDKYEMKLTNSFKVSLPALCKEWASLVLFLSYETRIVDGKATGGKRMIYTSHHSCWDAKQRTGMNLPEKIHFKDGKLPAELAAIFGPAPAAPAAPAPVITEVQPPAAPAPAVPTELVQLHDQLKGLLKASNVTVAALQAEIGRKGICPADMHPRNYNEATLKRIIGNWDKVLTNIRLIESK
jgi:hypothetical protein